MTVLAQITNEACRERFTDALRKYVGPGKNWTTEAAADRLDIDRRTLQSYLAGENFPTIPKLLRMASLLGSGFANPILEIAGLSGCYRVDPDAITDFELNADACKLVGDLGKALREGRIDHRCRPEIADDIRELVSAMQEWLALNDPVAANDAVACIDTTPRGAA